MKNLLFVSLLCAGLPALAYAQDPWTHDSGQVEHSLVYVSTSMPSVDRSDYWLDFDALDQNRDGRLSRAEVNHPAPSQTTSTALANLAREFRAVDENGDGYLDRTEIPGWL